MRGSGKAGRPEGKKARKEGEKARRLGANRLRRGLFLMCIAGSQLNRAADSVGANIAEAAGRWTKAERRRFLLNARGSLYETENWIDRARARHLPLPESADNLDRLAHALAGLIRRHSS